MMTPSLKQLNDWLAKQDDDETIAREIIGWTALPKSTIDNVSDFLTTYLPMLKSKLAKETFIEALIGKAGIVIPLSVMIKDVLPAFNNNHDKPLLMSMWLSMPNNEKDADAIILPMLHHFETEGQSQQPEANDSPDVQAIQQLFTTESEQAILIAGWLRNPAHDLSEDIFLKIYPLIRGKIYRAEAETLASFASKKSGTSQDEHARRLMFVLELIRQNDPESGRRVLNEWAASEDKTIGTQDVLDIMGSLNNEDDKYSFANTWFQNRNHQDPRVLLQMLPLFKNPEDQSNLACTLISNLRFSNPVMFTVPIESLMKIVLYINENVRAQYIESWLGSKNNTLNDNEFEQLMDLVPADERKISILKIWVKDRGNKITLAQLIKYIPIYKKDDWDNSESFIEEWMKLPENKNNLKILLTILSVYPSLVQDYKKEGVVKEAIQNAEAVDENDAEKALGLFEYKNDRTNIAEVILAKSGCVISGSVFQIILQQSSQIFGDYQKNKLAEIWLERPENEANFEALHMAIPFILVQYGRVEKIRKWVKASKNKINTDALIQFISTATVEDAAKLELFTIWLQETDQYTTDDVDKIIETIKDEAQKTTVLSKWLYNVRASEKHVSGSIESVLRLCAQFKGDSDILKVFAVWYNNNPEAKPTSANIVSLLLLLEDDNNKMDVAVDFLGTHGNSVDAASLADMLLVFKKGYYYTKDLIKTWIKQEQNPEKQFQRFKDLVDAKAIGSRYTEAGIKKIIDAFLMCIDDHKKIPDLCKHLYPNNEHMQSTFLIELIPFVERNLQLKGNDNATTNQLLSQLIKTFAGSLHESDPCLELLQFGKQYGIKPIDILVIANNRLASKFASLAEVLDKPLMPLLNAKGRAQLRVLFGDLPPDTKLSALFAYADIQGQLEKLFTGNVEQHVIDEIKENFKPSSSSPYMAENEHAALTQAFNIDPLPKMESLCDYLKSKVSPTPPTARSISNLKYAVQSEKQESSTEIEYKKAFLKVLSTMETELPDNLKQQAVVDFFNFITGTEQGNEQKLNLYKLFIGLKQELVYLFSEKNGITNYLGILAGLAEGCVANISMKTKMYIYGYLIDPKNQNPQNVMLYLFLCDHIAYPFFATGDKLGGSATGASADVFENPELRALRISVPGLLAGMTDEFYNLPEAPSDILELKPKIMPSKYIKPLASPAECTGFYDNLYDAYGENDDPMEGLHDSFKQEAEVASYLILRKAMPELLNSPYVEASKASCENWLSNDFEPEEQERSKTRLK